MAITSYQEHIINRMNNVAWKTQLGTIIKDLVDGETDLTYGSIFVGGSGGESTELDVSAGGNIIQGNDTTVEVLDASGSGYIMIGNGTKLASVAVSGDVTISSAGVVTIGAGKIHQSMIDDREIYDDFEFYPIQAAKGGGAPTGTTGDINVLYSGKQMYEWSVLGAGQTLVSFTYDTNGVNFAQDQGDDEGCEITTGIFSRSVVKFTCGTDDFYMQVRLKIADVSGTDDCAVGFRKLEAYQANIDDYDEMVALNVISGDVKVETIINNGGTITTDTTENVADTNYVDLRIEVSSTNGLADAITLANDLKAKYNLHIADVTAHTASADATNVITSADATDLASLITLVTELLTDYDLHDDDAELGAAWVYHAAQEAADASPADTTAPTDLPECMYDLTNLKAEMDTHFADTTAHGAATTAVAADDASNVYYKVGVNGAAVDEPATIPAGEVANVIQTHTFDDGEVVIPFIYFLHTSDFCDTIYLQHFECGLL